MTPLPAALWLTPWAAPRIARCAALLISAAPVLAQEVQEASSTSSAEPSDDPNAGLTIVDVLGRLPEPLTPDTIMAATYQGGDLPAWPSPLTVKVQVLLDQAGISPGVIDGVKGGMSESALRAYELREGLPVDGVLDPDVWTRLSAAAPLPVLGLYTVTAEDASNLTPEIPEDYAEKALLPALGYQRTTERLAELFHMDEDFLLALNPGAGFAAGETVVVANVGLPVEAEVAFIEVRKGSGRLAAFDAAGTMVANYPVTVGSPDTPLPVGTVEVVAVAFDPTYHYNPENFVQGENTEPLTLPAGPNGPVGSIWIDLSVPTYGLHGTPNPASLFTAQSHGCVRLTNWDAEELAHMVSAGTVVEFTEG